MSLIKIFNNIGCNFSIVDNNFLIGASLPGYNTLTDDHVGNYIPYLVRNINGSNIVGWEIGVGLVTKTDLKIIVVKHRVLQHYGSLESDGQKYFYLFSNADNYNLGFNNVIVVNQDFDIQKVKATYLIDSDAQLVHATLPNASECEGLEIQLKIIGQNPIRLDIKDNNEFHYVLRDATSYLCLVSDGNKWILLNENISNKSDSLFSSFSTDFQIQSDPVGDDGSFQYKDGSSFASANVYWGSNNKLLLGPDTTENNAKHIIPTSGEYDTIINNTKNKSDFIVHGSGVPSGYLPKNLIFTYDGKLGLNLPSGTKPQTALHIINNSCRESIRIENLSSCPTHIPSITLYHKPSGITDGTKISTLVSSSRDSNKNKTDYTRIESIAKNTSAGSTKGQLNLVVASGSENITTLSSDADTTNIGYTNNSNITINNGSGIKLHNNTINSAININQNNISIISNNVGISGNNISFSGISNLNQALIVNGTSVAFPYIATNKILSINSSGYLSPATNFSISGIGPNRLVTTDSNSNLVGSYANDAFLLTDGDVTWSKYSPRLANVCLRQITPIDPFPANEFGVGDQLAIITGVFPNQGTVYRVVSELTQDNNLVTSILLDQNVTSIESTISCYSITKGGVLTNQLRTQDGVESDATAIVLSTRPETDTIFNTKQRNINFKIFGVEDSPALSILAQGTVIPVNSGTYYTYSTRFRDSNNINISPFPTLISAIGEGVGTANNSANFGNINSVLWSGQVTSVGTNGRASFYGTYDQNGNVYEWVEDINPVSSNTTQNVCGGSWRTAAVEGLRGVIPTPYNLALDDVGFRICSRYGYNSDINLTLDLDFVPVSNLDNISDDSPVYTESYLNRSGLNLPPTPLSILNLGKVEQPYQISQYEITNKQYAQFLNAVNTTNIHTLYNPLMSGSPIGGINRSGSDGSFSYSTKTNMDNKPVVFVDYISSIRFINWLHNGAPTGTGVNGSHTEDGAYTIIQSLSSTTITKNKDQKYWLPNINEWHKAAYFQPIYVEANSNASAVLVRRDVPFEISSNTLASLSIDGATYSDNIVIGSNDNATGSLLSTADSTNQLATINLGYGYNNYLVNIGPTDNIIFENGSVDWDGAYSSYISPLVNKGIQLATSGDIKLLSPNCIKMSGLCVDDIFIKNITYVDPISGDPIEGGLYPGPNGGFIYKDITTDSVRSSDALSMIIDAGISGVALSSATFNEAIYVNEQGVLAGYPELQFGVPVEGLGDVPCVALQATGTGVMSPPLIVDSIRIGPALASFSGSILTHNGAGTALWQPADFLRADGVTWTRNKRRAVEILSNNLLRFSSRGESEGGTGSVSVNEILQEFSINDTIAIYNQARDVEYVKIAAIVPVGQPDENISFFNNESLLEVVVCPALPVGFLQGSLVQIEALPDAFIGYAFSVQKGAYLSMFIEPNATSRFSCENGIDDDDSPYGFKPSTQNTISIRPTIDTTFNKLAEDIDFLVYGYRKTLNDRYEVEIFGQNNRGVPTGLIPAIKVDVFDDSSYIGSYSSGVINTNSSVIASGIIPDESAKIIINSNEPYVVASISGVRRGIISPSPVRPTGQDIQTSKDISTYADLTVNGYTFSNSVITTELILKNSDRYSFIPNAPLTINSLGQLVSIVPPPVPTLPGIPTNVIGYAGNGGVRLIWTAPEEDGNSPILDYTIQYSENQTTWNTYDHETITDTQLLVTGLENGIAYYFRVAAINAIGSSNFSENSASITPTTNAPGLPNGLTIINRSTTEIVIDWSAPTYQGPTGQTIQNYIVEYAESVDPPGPLTWITWPETIGTVTNLTITGITEEPTYYIRVRAQNGLTTGLYSSIKSIGTDEEPVNPEPEPEPENDWDFGEISFTGVCI